jgi:hypothetical protein
VLAQFTPAFRLELFVWNGESDDNTGNEQDKDKYQHQHKSEVLVK